MNNNINSLPDYYEKLKHENGGKDGLISKNEMPKSVEESCQSSVSGETEAADLDLDEIPFEEFESSAQTESTNSLNGATKSQNECNGLEETNSLEEILQNWSADTQNCDLADERPTSSNKIGDKSNSKNDKKQNENSTNIKMQYPTNGFGQIKWYMIWARECLESIKGRYKLGFKEHSELRKKLGEKWRSMPKEEREPWEKKAVELKQQFIAAGNKFNQPNKKKRSHPIQINSMANKKKCNQTLGNNTLAENLVNQQTIPFDFGKRLFLIGEGNEWRQFVEASYEKKERKIYVYCKNCMEIKKIYQQEGHQYYSDSIGRAKIDEATKCVTLDSMPIVHLDECEAKPLDQLHNELFPQNVDNSGIIVVQSKLGTQIFPSTMNGSAGTSAQKDEEDDCILIEDEDEEFDGRKEEEGKKKKKGDEQKTKLRKGIEQIGREFALEIIKSDGSIILSPKNASNRSLSLVQMEGILLVNGFVGNKLKETIRWTIPSVEGGGIEQLIFAIRGKCHQFFYLNPSEMGGEEACGWMLRTN